MGEVEDSRRLHADIYCVLEHIQKTAGISWWITGGTLLGAVREGKILDHDEDGDICVMAENADMFAKNITAEGISVYPWWYGYRVSLASSKEMVYDGPIKKQWHNTFRFPFVDVFVLEKDSNGVARLLPEALAIVEARKAKWSKEIAQSWDAEFYRPGEVEPLRQATLGRLTLPIPAKAEAILERMYGNWRVPVVYKYPHGEFAVD